MVLNPSRVGIRLGLNEALEQLIGVFELLFILDLHAFREYPLSHAGIVSHEMNSFDYRLHHPVENIGIFRDELLCCVQTGLLKQSTSFSIKQ